MASSDCFNAAMQGWAKQTDYWRFYAGLSSEQPAEKYRLAHWVHIKLKENAHFMLRTRLTALSPKVRSQGEDKINFIYSIKELFYEK